MPSTLHTKRTRWTELIVGVLTFCAAVVVWQTLELYERHQIQRAVSLAGNTIQADLLADIQSNLRSQVYLAQHADEREKFGSWDWPDTQQYMHHNPSCLAIMWLNNEERIGWVVPAAADQEMLRQAVVQHVTRGLAEGLLTQQPRITHNFQLSTGETVVLTVVPVVRAGNHVGSLVIVSDVHKLLEAMLEDVSQLGYNMAIYDEDREIYRLADSPRDEQRWGSSAEVQIPGVIWRLRVWPRAETLAQARSLVPAILFVVVSGFGVALVLAVHFECVARTKSKSADMMNAQLTSEIAERQRIEVALRDSQERLAGVLETSADAIISTDKSFRITYFNRAAEKIFGYRTEEVIGLPLNMLLPPRFRESHRVHMARFAAGPQATMLMGERSGVVGMRKDGTEFPADAAISKLEANQETVLTVFLRDVTARVAAEEALRKAHEQLEHRVAERTAELAVANASLHRLSSHLLQSQEDERRRIARELHDSTAQNLVLIAMTLEKMRASALAANVSDLDECWRWVQQTMNDIRTLSYRLHPPMLEGLGLGPALQWYIKGFSERSGVDILLKFDPSTPRLPQETELTLFRIVQESLTNIHRHSQSKEAEISVTCEDLRIRLEIADRGVGIRPELLTDGTARLGVGIAGMCERVRQLGGELDVQSGASGTTITVILPRARKSSPAVA